MAGWYTTVVKEDMGGKSEDALAKETDSWIDVRDLALAHVRAIQRDEAQGRVIVGAGKPPFMHFSYIHIDLVQDPSSGTTFVRPSQDTIVLSFSMMPYFYSNIS